MPENRFYSKLYAVQDKVLKLVQDENADFYLTGGTALSRGYLNHRYSDDLDFFMNQAPDFKLQVERVVGAFRQAGLELYTGTVSESFVRMTVRINQISIKVDFVNDVEYHYGEFKTADFFHKIDSWRNILSNKLCAISRLEPKDVADILFTSKNFQFYWPEIIEEAKEKDLWVDPLEVCRILDSFKINLFDTVKWAFPVDKAQLAREHTQMHDDLFYGKDNSLVNL